MMYKKPDWNTFRRIIVFVAGLVLFFAVMDIIGMHMWDALGGWSGETYLVAEPFYMAQFWSFAFMVIIAASAVYYMLRHDWSETIAVFVAGAATVWGGVEDLFFYFFLGRPLDSSMTWLINTPVGTVARILGHDTVTPITLLLNILLYGWVGYLIIKWLYKQKW